MEALFPTLDSTKSVTDRKSYRVVHLPNGIRVLLVSEQQGATVSRPILQTASSNLSRVEIEGGESPTRLGSVDSGESESLPGDELHENDSSSMESEEAESGEEDEGTGTGPSDVVGGGDDDDSNSPEQKAAVAIAVKVGSFADPLTVDGLAHFLEHMLFMGSEKYPAENAMDSFLSEHGGGVNAMTEGEYTMFYFDVDAEYLRPAMDRVSQCFIAPLWKEDATERELQAIESEYHSARSGDFNRLQAVFCRTISTSHPAARFAWGNIRSLKEIPEEKNINVREVLLNLFRDGYKAGAMEVVVRGHVTLDTLEQWAKDCFADVAPGEGLAYGGWGWGESQSAKNIKPTPFKKWREGSILPPMLSPYTEDASCPPPCVFAIPPIKDTHTLILSWVFPPLKRYFKSNPDDYLGHLLGHEVRSSSYSLLPCGSPMVLGS